LAGWLVGNHETLVVPVPVITETCYLVTTRGSAHRITIPAGGPLRVGTLAEILSDVAEHSGVSRAELENQLLG
jgi:hypothetical protein